MLVHMMAPMAASPTYGHVARRAQDHGSYTIHKSVDAVWHQSIRYVGKMSTTASMF